MVEERITKDHIHIYVFKSGDEFNQTEKCDRSNKYIVSISNQNLGVQIFYYNVLCEWAYFLKNYFIFQTYFAKYIDILYVKIEVERR